MANGRKAKDKPNHTHTLTASVCSHPVGQSKLPWPGQGQRGREEVRDGLPCDARGRMHLRVLRISGCPKVCSGSKFFSLPYVNI